MDPTEKPGPNEPKSSDPTEPLSEVEVEKTLEKLESITSKLVREVGTPSDKTQVQTPAPPAVAPPTAAPVNPPPRAASAPDAAQTRPQTGGQATAQGIAAAAPPAAASPASKPAPLAAPGPTAAAQPAAPKGGPAEAAPTKSGSANAAPNDPAPPAANSQTTVPPQVAAPKAVSSQARATTEPPSSSQAADARQSADTEVDQEISQAIHQLEAGKSPAPASPTGPPGQKPAAPAAQPIPASVLGRWRQILDRILWPLVVLITLMDLPFRRLPGAVRQLLGYVAVGTALMAVAVWYYIFMLRGR